MPRLSPRLSPAARKAVLMEAPDRSLRALVEVVSPEAVEALRRRLAEAGATLGRWSEGSRLLTLEAPAGRLAEIADLEGVAYLDLATAFRQDD